MLFHNFWILFLINILKIIQVIILFMNFSLHLSCYSQYKTLINPLNSSPNEKSSTNFQELQSAKITTKF